VSVVVLLFLEVPKNVWWADSLDGTSDVVGVSQRFAVVSAECSMSRSRGVSELFGLSGCSP
jgi:hypothetical protein